GAAPPGEPSRARKSAFPSPRAETPPFVLDVPAPPRCFPAARPRTFPQLNWQITQNLGDALGTRLSQGTHSPDGTIANSFGPPRYFHAKPFPRQAVFIQRLYGGARWSGQPIRGWPPCPPHAANPPRETARIPVTPRKCYNEHLAPFDIS